MWKSQTPMAAQSKDMDPLIVLTWEFDIYTTPRYRGAQKKFRIKRGSDRRKDKPTDSRTTKGYNKSPGFFFWCTELWKVINIFLTII